MVTRTSPSVALFASHVAHCAILCFTLCPEVTWAGASTIGTKGVVEGASASAQECDKYAVERHSGAFDYIQAIQTPVDCATAEYYHLDMAEIMNKGGEDSRGFAALAREATVCFMAAVARKKVFVLDGRIGTYGYARELFLPTSPCAAVWPPPSYKSITEVTDIDCSYGIESLSTSTRRKLYGGRDVRRGRTYWIRAQKYFKLVPTKFVEIGYNLHSWMGVLQRWMLRPAPALQDEITRIRAGIDYPSHDNSDRAGIVGVHIRHGDKARDAGRLTDPAEYIAHAVALHKLAQRAKGTVGLNVPSLIFLATDSDSVVPMMEASLAKVVQHFKLIGNTDALREGKRLRAQFQAGSIAGAVLQMDAKTRFRAAAEVVADIHMLAGSDFLLGVCWSGVSAIASGMHISRLIDKRGAPFHIPLYAPSDTCMGSWWPDSCSYTTMDQVKLRGWDLAQNRVFGGWVSNVTNNGVLTSMP